MPTMAGSTSVHSAMSVATKEKMLPKYPHLEWVSYSSAHLAGAEEPRCLPPRPGDDDEGGELLSSPVGTKVFNALRPFPGEQQFSC